ncbi:DUF4860 domain-containing protein [Butyrivibrio fibrisolvens]|jgi:uncharacterized protein (UPF0333 family)|uniref:DUF4860 domain-containing protein n=1 Tax=Butyrivibrio fibrisolvens TaxID=831 RepID=A0A1H9MM86_BUTFI|nr:MULTISPECIES: DUF4860 domain-containing protein [Butyrivibrio]MBQ1458582.1 DUF4860 domain-containing protein [Butyrivibrio sp.]SER24806.1 protein of unknown function [Butyrivibrio fibrisolvens]
MNPDNDKRHIIDIFFIISLLFGFVFCAVLIIALGASIYERGVSSSNSNFGKRTASTYIVQKVRQSDDNGAISVGDIGDIPALTITRTIGGSSYTTYMYVYNGYLMEVFARTDIDISPQSGQRIIKMNAMDIKISSSNLITVEITDMEGQLTEVLISPLSQGGQT